MKISKVAPFLIITILLTYLFSGCATMIGFGIGASIDASNPKYSRIARAGIKSLECGTPIRVTLVDSTTVIGEYAGFAAAYPDSTSLPSLLEAIHAIDSIGLSHRGLFQGFYYHCTLNDCIPYLVLQTDEGLERLDIRSIPNIVREDGGHLEHKNILMEFGGQGLPSGVSIILKNSSGANTVSLSQIVTLETGPRESAIRRGLKIGLLLDALYYACLAAIFLLYPPDLS